MRRLAFIERCQVTLPSCRVNTLYTGFQIVRNIEECEFLRREFESKFSCFTKRVKFHMPHMPLDVTNVWETYLNQLK